MYQTSTGFERIALAKWQVWKSLQTIRRKRETPTFKMSEKLIYFLYQIFHLLNYVLLLSVFFSHDDKWNRYDAAATKKKERERSVTWSLDPSSQPAFFFYVFLLFIYFSPNILFMILFFKCSGELVRT